MSNIPLDNDLDIFGAAIQGQSLTANPGQFPYEKPPLTSNPENALNSLVEHIQTPAAKKTIINLLEAGLTAETIASALVLGGVSEGLYDVNVAELIKAPLIMYLVEIGDDEGIDIYVSTSSAGGGLQMMVAGVVKSMSGESAERAALGAGSIVMDVLASNDGRKPHEKITRIRQLRPDMILLSGGVDGGTTKHVVELAEILKA